MTNKFNVKQLGTSGNLTTVSINYFDIKAIIKDGWNSSYFQSFEPNREGNTVFYFETLELDENTLKTIRKEILDNNKVITLYKLGSKLAGFVKLDWLNNRINSNDKDSSLKSLMTFVMTKLGLGSKINRNAFSFSYEASFSSDYTIHFKGTWSGDFDTLPNAVEEPTDEELKAFHNTPEPSTKDKTFINNQLKATFQETHLNAADSDLLERVYNTLTNKYASEIAAKEYGIPSIRGRKNPTYAFVLQAVKYNFGVNKIVAFLKTKWELPTTAFAIIKQMFKTKAVKQNVGKKLRSYNPNDTTSTEYLEEGEYMDKVFNYSEYSADNFKLNIIAGTGAGKTFASLKYCKDSGKRVILASPSLGIINNIRKTAKELGITYGTYCSEIDGKDWEGKQFIGTTYQSLPNLVRDIWKSGDTSLKTDSVLVIDEIHTIGYDAYKEYDKDVFSWLIANANSFEKVVTLTGTPNSSLLTSFADYELLKVERKQQVDKSFAVVKMLDNKNKYEEHYKIIKKYQDEGYFTFVFNQNTKKTGWLGKMQSLLRQRGLNFATLNAKVKGDTEYQRIVNDGIIELNEFQGALTTSVIREGVSFDTYKDGVKSSTKIAYIFLTPQDTDTVEQFSNRVRNPQEIKAINVFQAFKFAEKDKEPVIKWFCDNKAGFSYNSTIEKIYVLAEKEAEEEYNKEELRTYGRLLKPLESSYLNYKGEICEVKMTQELTRVRIKKELSDWAFMAWLMSERYNYSFKGIESYSELKIEKEETQVVEATVKAEKEDVKAKYSVVAKDFAKFMETIAVQRYFEGQERNRTPKEILRMLIDKIRLEECPLMKMLLKTAIDLLKRVETKVRGGDFIDYVLDIMLGEEDMKTGERKGGIGSSDKAQDLFRKRFDVLAVYKDWKNGVVFRKDDLITTIFTELEKSVGQVVDGKNALISSTIAAINATPLKDKYKAKTIEEMVEVSTELLEFQLKSTRVEGKVISKKLVKLNSFIDSTSEEYEDIPFIFTVNDEADKGLGKDEQPKTVRLSKLIVAK